MLGQLLADEGYVLMGLKNMTYLGLLLMVMMILITTMGMLKMMGERERVSNNKYDVVKSLFSPKEERGTRKVKV